MDVCISRRLGMAALLLCPFGAQGALSELMRFHFVVT